MFEQYRLLISGLLVIMAGLYVGGKEFTGKGDRRLTGAKMARVLLGVTLICWGGLAITIWLNRRQHFATDAGTRILLGVRLFVSGLATGIVVALVCVGRLVNGNGQKQ